MKKLYIFCLAACSLTACKPNLDPETPDSGQLNLQRYLAIGDSYTAGVSDGSLTKSGQTYSYPAMIAEQFGLAGGGEFKQPLVPGDNGYPVPKRVLAVTKGLCDTASSIKPVPYPGALDSINTSLSIALNGPFNNTGIANIRTTDFIDPAFAGNNIYARRFFSNFSARPIDEMMRMNPTFFSLWIGNNDVLDYARLGGRESMQALTEPAEFRAAYDTVLRLLTSKGAQGVSMNIPDITSLPYFTAIPAKGLTLTRKQADDLNFAYNGTFIRFNEGLNYFVIQEGADIRLMREGELVLLSLPMDSVKCAGWGSRKPIPGNYVLTLEEVNYAQSTIAQYNSIINALNAAKNIPVADMNTYFKTIQSGVSFNGISYNAEFVSGAFFSLDGLHPSARGYALIANQILTSINRYYDVTIPMVDANKFPSIKYP